LLTTHQLFCGLYYLPFYFMAVKFKSPTAAGVALFPFMCAFLPGSAIVSQLITRLGRFRWAIWAGWFVATLGIGLLILIDLNTKTAVWAGVQVLFGLGSGMIVSSVNFGIQAIVRTEDCGRAACMYAFMRTLGMTIGVAVGGTVFQNLMAHRLGDLSLPVEIAKNAEAYISILKTLAATDPTRLGILQAYVHGFKGVFEVLAGISGVGLLASLFIKHHDMNKVLKSSYRLSGQFE
jgi:MFS family permease